jgi:serine/threonine-protein kinase
VTWWRRFVEALAGPAEPPPPPAPPPTVTPEEAKLRALLQRPPDATPGGGEVGDRDFWAAIGTLLSTGRERTAIDLLGRFVAARPADLELTQRLAELLCERREDAVARPLVERLLAHPAHALRARFLYGELAARAGQLDEARRHFEAVLAVDLDYPRARACADELAPHAPAPPPAAAPTLAGLTADEQRAGRYRLRRELGRGAAGAVYLALDEELGRELALKILHPHARAEARARAWAEARLAAAARHPGVVAIYDLDEERGLIAMELCAGGSLAALLARGALSPEHALARARELFSTLAAVHRRGVVHGDLKPANLLFRGMPADGELVLGDFGLARLGAAAPSDGRARLSSARPAFGAMEARGTLGYLAPEARRGEMGAAADLYAAGVILVEMLCGSPALAGWLGDRAALVRGEARWDGRLPESVGDGVRALAAALLDEEPARRPDADEVLRSLG